MDQCFLDKRADTANTTRRQAKRSFAFAHSDALDCVDHVDCAAMHYSNEELFVSLVIRELEKLLDEKRSPSHGKASIAAKRSPK